MGFRFDTTGLSVLIYSHLEVSSYTDCLQIRGTENSEKTAYALVYNGQSFKFALAQIKFGGSSREFNDNKHFNYFLDGNANNVMLYGLFNPYTESEAYFVGYVE